MLHHEQTISGEEMHTLITFMVSVMASNIVYGLYNPLIDYIRSHVCSICAVLLYSKASSLCTVEWYTVACKPNLYVRIYTYDGIKVVLLYDNTGYLM